MKTVPEKETSREETLGRDSLATGKDLRCTRRFAAIAGRDARFLLSRPETSPFTAVSVLQTTAPVDLREGIAKDQDSRTKGCLMRYALPAEEDLSFPSGQPAKNLFTATNVLTRAEALRTEAMKRPLINIKSSSKC